MGHQQEVEGGPEEEAAGIWYVPSIHALFCNGGTTGSLVQPCLHRGRRWATEDQGLAAK